MASNKRGSSGGFGYTFCNAVTVLHVDESNFCFFFFTDTPLIYANADDDAL